MRRKINLPRRRHRLEIDWTWKRLGAAPISSAIFWYWSLSSYKHTPDKRKTVGASPTDTTIFGLCCNSSDFARLAKSGSAILSGPTICFWCDVNCSLYWEFDTTIYREDGPETINFCGRYDDGYGKHSLKVTLSGSIPDAAAMLDKTGRINWSTQDTTELNLFVYVMGSIPFRSTNYPFPVLMYLYVDIGG